MRHLVPLVVLAAHVMLGVLVPFVVARRAARAWTVPRQVPRSAGYRDAPHRALAEPLLPPGLLAHVGGAVALGSVGVWPALSAIARPLEGPTALGLLGGAPAGFEPPVDLRALALGASALLLGGIALAALRLLSRGAGALAAARSVGGVAVALGALVALPMLAWPRWFGADAAAAGALGILTALAGAILLRGAGLAHEAELALWSEPVLFDES